MPIADITTLSFKKGNKMEVGLTSMILSFDPLTQKDCLKKLLEERSDISMSRKRSRMLTF